MSDLLETVDSWDYTKNITGLEVNTAYITGLENILMFYIANIVEDPSTLAVTFKKFEAILKGEVKEEVDLTLLERQMYTLFSLLQLLKIKGYEQKLNVKVETSITKEQLEEYMKVFMTGDQEAAKKKLEDLMSSQVKS